jgi:transglutaminase-like putative cysteine protease
MIVSIRADLDYAVEGAAPVLMQIEAADLPDQHVVKSRLDIEDALDFVRVVADEGVGERSLFWVRKRLLCRYAAEVAIDRKLGDIRKLEAAPLPALPGAAVKYLMPSRYCQSDLFEGFVEAEFGKLAGGARVAAMRKWIEKNLSYVRGSSDERTTVMETFVERKGICRDYAHLMITLARASGMPARMVSVYAPDVTPPDFHAVAEVFVGGEWRLVDPTGMAEPDTMVRIGVGRDAADVAFLIVYGQNELKKQKVAVKRK